MLPIPKVWLPIPKVLLPIPKVWVRKRLVFKAGSRPETLETLEKKADALFFGFEEG